MAYSDIIQKLFTINLHSGIKLGLQNVLKLQYLLNFPDRSFRSVHIAGTNGKGSVSTKIASAFEQAGYRVGLYTSPHISSFRERIRINGKMIPEDEVESLLGFLFSFAEENQIPATFFELTTFLAFLYFAKEKVDIAVLESGLGGRLDATNIVHPCLSIITSISLDHTEILGNTLEEITLEKGGIIKENVPIIIGPHVPSNQIQELASTKNAICIQDTYDGFLFEEENRSTARTALRWLSSEFNLSNDAIEKGLEGRQPCRFEILHGPPCVILDVAHNPDGLRYLFQSIDHYFPKRPLRLLFGLSKSKDLNGCLQVITAHPASFHLVEANNGRGVPIDDLYSALQKFPIEKTKIFKHEMISDGVEFALQKALNNGEVLVIFGTFFIMSSARKALGIIEPSDKIDLNEKYSLDLLRN